MPKPPFEVPAPVELGLYAVCCLLVFESCGTGVCVCEEER